MNNFGSPFQEKRPSGYREFSLQQFTPEQMKLLQDMYGYTGPESYTARLAGGDQQLIDQMEEPALRQFSQLQGGIASRFSGAGMGARRSSGFQNTLTAASQDFASELQSKRQETRRQAIMDLMGMSSSLLSQRPYEKGLVQKRQKPPGFLQSLAGSITRPLAQWGGSQLGGF